MGRVRGWDASEKEVVFDFLGKVFVTYIPGASKTLENGYGTSTCHYLSFFIGPMSQIPLSYRVLEVGSRNMHHKRARGQHSGIG